MAMRSDARLTEQQVREVMARYANGEAVRSISASLEVSPFLINHVVAGRTYRSVRVPQTVRKAVERRRRNDPRNAPRRRRTVAPQAEVRMQAPLPLAPVADPVPPTALGIREERVMTDLAYVQQMVVEAATYVGDDIIEVRDWCREAGELLLDIAARMDRAAQG